MSAHSITNAKTARVVTALETKLNTIRNLEADFVCHKEDLSTMKKARMQRAVDSFLKKSDDSKALNSCYLSFFNKLLKCEICS
jgi:hypothetical protein